MRRTEAWPSRVLIVMTDRSHEREGSEGPLRGARAQRRRGAVESAGPGCLRWFVRQLLMLLRFWRSGPRARQRLGLAVPASARWPWPRTTPNHGRFDNQPNCVASGNAIEGLPSVAARERNASPTAFRRDSSLKGLCSTVACRCPGGLHDELPAAATEKHDRQVRLRRQNSPRELVARHSGLADAREEQIDRPAYGAVRLELVTRLDDGKALITQSFTDQRTNRGFRFHEDDPAAPTGAGFMTGIASLANAWRKPFARGKKSRNVVP